jgi:hypothetical protein
LLVASGTYERYCDCEARAASLVLGLAVNFAFRAPC